MEVDRALSRGCLKTNEVLKHLGVSRASYFRWKKDEAWKRERAEPVKPVQAFEALPEEKQAVVQYALEHPGVRHRELAWRMIDDDVAYLSMSTVYRILLSEELMCLRRGRKKRYRDEGEKASRPDVFEGWWNSVLPAEFHRRVLALPSLLGVIDEHGRTFNQYRSPEST